MCMGLPMVVIETDGITALCERRGERCRVSVILLETVAPGDDVLVFLGNAVRSLEPDEARQIDNALDGLAAALAGEEFNHLFADIGQRDSGIDQDSPTDGEPGNGTRLADERFRNRQH